MNSSTSSCTTISSLSLCTLMDFGAETQSGKKRGGKEGGGVKRV